MDKRYHKQGITVGLEPLRAYYVPFEPEETYCDTYNFVFKEKYNDTVDRQYHHYVKPQESGSHYIYVGRREQFLRIVAFKRTPRSLLR